MGQGRADRIARGMEAGRVELHVRAVDLDEMLINVEALTAPRLQAWGLVHARAEACSLASARADPEKLARILLNLGSNAIRLTGAGGRMAVECVNEDERVCIAVRDTGPGSPRSGWPTSSSPTCRWTAI